MLPSVYGGFLHAERLSHLGLRQPKRNAAAAEEGGSHYHVLALHSGWQGVCVDALEYLRAPIGIGKSVPLDLCDPVARQVMSAGSH